MLVKDVMTKRVITVSPSDTLGDVLKKLVKYNISGMPVVNKRKKVVGIVTEEDIINTIDAFSPKIRYDTKTSFAVILAVLKYKDMFSAVKEEIVGSKKVKVKDFMKRKVITISPEDTLEKAARLMEKYKVKRLPVIKDGKLVGIISRGDIIRALTK